MRGLVVAAVTSGSGKTLVSLALMAWFQRIGLQVQPFKVGPDFIDPGHHRAVTGRFSHNLDGWMLSGRANREIFLRYGRDADVCLVEGVMGLFDGFSPTGESGSTAEMAKWLGLPVLLIADARSMARSAAAVVKGFAELDPDLSLAGVVFNGVGSQAHAGILREAVHYYTGIPCLGFLQKEPDLSLPSRHLGLVTAEESDWESTRISRLADWISEGISQELKDPLRPGHVMGREAGPTREPEEAVPVRSSISRVVEGEEVRIGVAADQAFCFYYRENLRLLEEAGAKLCFFSPLYDSGLPPDLEGIYLGGGYPELYAPRLAQNSDLLAEVARFADSGGVIYAECGGFMYLMQGIRDPEGEFHSMVGVFPFTSVMGERFRALGYREVRMREQTPLGRKGTTLRGHEFHYSFLESGEGYGLRDAYRVLDRRGEHKNQQGFLHQNVLGSYIHLHFASNPESARFFVASCREEGSGFRADTPHQQD